MNFTPVAKMNFTPVTSSNIDAAAWNEMGLYLRFKSGAVYLYINAPEQVYKDLLAAESAGKFFHANIKMHYTFVIQPPRKKPDVRGTVC